MASAGSVLVLGVAMDQDQTARRAMALGQMDRAAKVVREVKGRREATGRVAMVRRAMTATKPELILEQSAGHCERSSVPLVFLGLSPRTDRRRHHWQ